MGPGRARSAIAVLVSAVVGASMQRALDRRSPAVPGWTRANYAGRPVTLTGGVSAALASVLTAVVLAPAGRRRGVLTAATAAAAAGAYDDLIAPRWEQSGDKGARGHLQALLSGRPSGGVVKVVLIGAGAFSGAPARTSRGRRCADAALVAGAANLVNLFDLRPGRAAKVTVLAGAPLVGLGAATAGAAVGAAAAALPADLGERHLLGDTGANPLGALLGLALTCRGRRARAGALVVILALTAASERVSFSRVIDSVGPLRALDGWGRRRDNQR